MNIQRLTSLGSLLLLPIALASGASADPATPAAPATNAAPIVDMTPAKVDAKAMALLGDVEKATASAKGLTADFTVTSSFDPEKPAVVQEGAIQYLKPNYMHTDAWLLKKDETSGQMARDGAPITIASNGKSEWIVMKDGEYHQSDVDPMGKGLSNGYDPSANFFDPSRSALKQIDDQKQKHLLVSLTYGGQQTWEGKKYDVVDWVAKPGFNFPPAMTKKAPNGVVLYTQHLYIGSDKLVHRQAYDYNFGATGERAIRNVQINPKMTAKNFDYTLPVGAHLPKPPPPPTPVLANGVAAPDFLATTSDGKEVHLSDYKGKRVIIDFWATWCGPCQASMPHLNNVYKQVKDKDVVVLAVCVWDDKDSYAKWVTDNKTTYDFPTVFDPAGKGGKNIAGELYKVSGIPTQFVVDKDGMIAASNVGYMGETDHRLEAALAKTGVDIPVPEAPKS
ncbi:MAG: redoxin domain-containing protein [Capsulimonas sp.]|uniref:redoxin domain-containing protein n=1 Tax=Capsulimonas sp. TaxID=2494211 RepID=UPI003265B948